MKRNFRVQEILLSLVLVFVLYFPCPAQSPSLRETLDWLTKKVNLYSFLLNTNATFKFTCTYEATSSSTTFVLIKKCEEFELFANPSKKKQITSKFTIPLAEIDPRLIRMDKSGTIEAGTIKVRVELNALDKREVISLEEKSILIVGNVASPERVTNSQQNGVVIHFTDEIMANRVAQAFEHAIKESMKASSKTPEPF